MKQAIAVRADLGMGVGKLAAQVAHAALMAADEAEQSVRREWKGDGQKKVVLKVDTEDDLFELADAAERHGLPYGLVRDAGHTQLDPGTATALAVGPGSETAVDRITGDLPLY